MQRTGQTFRVKVCHMSLPAPLEIFASQLRSALGDARAEAVLGTMVGARRRAFLHNALMGPLPDVPARPLGLPGMHEWLADEAALTRHSATEAGLIYPMNPSSVLPVLALDVQPGQEVLDLAAAPGGKTLVMACAMENQGRIAAVEVVKGRFHRLRANLERCGVSIAQCYLDDGRRTGRKTGPRFDRVLLDAPCSSEARIRLDEPATFAHWGPRKVKEMARKQRGLIRSAFAALRPGGTLVYSTCSFSVDENERIVDGLLRAEPRARVEKYSVHGPSTMPGLVKWRSRDLDASLSSTLRVLPDDLWDGFYLAKILKEDASET